MTRRLLALILALMMAMALPGCGGKEEEQPDEAAAAEEQEEPEEEKEPEWRPEKDVTLIVPDEAGSLNDITARVLAQYLEREVGQAVVVENVPGAYQETNEDGEVTFEAGSGTAAWKQLADSKADGLTLGYVELPDYSNALQEWPDLIANRAYTPVCTHFTQTAVIIVRSTEDRFDSLKKMIRYGKRSDTPLLAAANKEQGLFHTWEQLLCKDADMPYELNLKKSVSGVLKSVREGTSDFAVVRADDILERDEGLRVLAVFGDERLPLYPDAPTVVEQGYYPDWLGCAWCVLAPAGTDPEAVAFYEKAFRDAMADERYLQASSSVTNDYKDAEDTKELLSSQVRISRQKYKSLWE